MTGCALCWHSEMVDDTLTQLKWFWHEKWRTQQRQSVQVIFGPVQWSNTEVWHTHIVPELAHCCEHLSLHSATEVFSPSLKCDSSIWKITSPISPAASLLSVSPQLMCWHGPQSHLRGKNRISWVTAAVLFPEVWQWAKASGFGIFPLLALPV